MKYTLFSLLILVGLGVRAQTKDTLTMKKIVTTLYPDIDFMGDTAGTIYVPNAPHIQLVPMFIVDGLTWWEILPEYHSDIYYHMGRNKGAAIPASVIPKDICDKCDPISGACWECHAPRPDTTHQRIHLTTN